MKSHTATALWLVSMVVVIVAVDVLFFKGRFWPRLAANLAIVVEDTDSPGGRRLRAQWRARRAALDAEFEEYLARVPPVRLQETAT